MAARSISFPSREGNSPHDSLVTIKPSNIRDTIQRQISKTVDQKLDEYAYFSIGNADGRYGYPAEVISLRDELGRKYHIVGLNTTSDWSVAAP
jgi:hypothetical protein